MAAVPDFDGSDLRHALSRQVLDELLRRTWKCGIVPIADLHFEVGPTIQQWNDAKLTSIVLCSNGDVGHDANPDAC